MSIHEKNISKSIDKCIVHLMLLKHVAYLKSGIYFSTNYVYPGTKGSYKTDPVMPINKYAISKLGGEYAIPILKTL